ncbi:MAG: hypothetical protein Q8Q06_03685 [bacterium]|nr:hypothetical protein [bacterium]
MALNTFKQYKQEQKKLARKLRRQGFSYSEIKKQVLVPKTTLAYWLRNIKLSEEQTGRLKKKRTDAARAGSRKKTLRTLEQIREIQKISVSDIGKISKRELWLMGLMLYWRERFLNKNDSDMQRGVRFTSSDSNLIKLFLKWLQDIGGLTKEEILFDIFMARSRSKKTNNAIAHWSGITGFPEKDFTRIYFQKIRIKKTKRQTIKNSQNGLLRIRVRASSMLARQISGWISGIQRYYWGQA